MKTDVKITLEEYEAEKDNDAGVCLACGEFTHGVEPDARGYECDCCGKHKVYGLDECLIMGLVS